MIITVLFGREKLQVDVSEEATFADIRKQIESQKQLKDNGVRLIHKGKKMPDETSLQSLAITSDTKIMAMRTEKQHHADQLHARLAKFNAQQEQRPSKTEAPAESTGKVKIGGDALIPEQTCVIICEARLRFRVNVPLTATGHEVKQRYCQMSAKLIEPGDVRLLAGGRFIKDDATLTQCGVSDTATIMALMSSRHHDTRQQRDVVTKLASDVALLEEKVAALQRRTAGRLATPQEIAVVRSNLTQDVKVVRDNLNVGRVPDERRAPLRKRLDELDTLLDDL